MVADKTPTFYLYRRRVQLTGEAPLNTDLRAQLQQSLGDAYRLERELGGGGMSRVFVATERALGRQVVIKVLPDEMAGAVSIERFKREIALAARLQQANIVPLLTAGETAGVPYFTMPYVEGQSLRVRLAEAGQLPIPEAIGILKEVARALAYAHEQGVVHRDIKPDNVLLSGGTAMVSDFGVAKALTAATADGTRSLTATGIAIGTPAYMAPEQATGDANVDRRADIYAFGCLAYELFAGAPPFAGRSAQGAIVAHLTEAPEAIGRRRPSVPDAVATLITRCLAKEPADRPQNAAELVAALTQAAIMPEQQRLQESKRTRSRVPLAVGVTAIVLVAVALLLISVSRRTARDAAVSVAVLPFENNSRDSTIDYLEDGISDQVRDAVGRLPGVSVKARSSSRRFKGRQASDAGRALGASLVLLGTFSRAGQRLHVTAELVRASDEDALWSVTFDGPADAMAGIQDSLVRAVSNELRVRPAQGAAGRGTSDAVAYDEFLRGRFEGDRTNWEQALRHFSAAVARDPKFARGHANVAIAYSNIPTTGHGAIDSLNALARASAARALALDSTVADAYLALSNAKANELQLAESIVPLERAVALDPTSVDARVALGFGLMQIGRPQEGFQQVRRAFQLDPLSSLANGVLSYSWFLNGRLDSAVARARAGLALDPGSVLMHQVLALALAFSGKRDSSAIESERAFQLGPDLFDGRANLVYAHVVAGRMAAALKERSALDHDRATNSPLYRRTMADLAIGRFDDAMAEMERGVLAREPLFGLLSMPCDPRFDPLKKNPRFDALMRRLGATACKPTMQWPFGAGAP